MLHHTHSLRHHMVRWLQLTNLPRHVITTQSAPFTLGLSPGAVSPVGLHKCVMTCIQQHSILQHSPTAPRILCALFTPPSPLTAGNPEFFTVSVVWPLPSCRIVGIIE